MEHLLTLLQSQVAHLALVDTTALNKVRFPIQTSVMLATIAAQVLGLHSQIQTMQPRL